MSKRTDIVNVGYRSTNYWVVSAGGPRLLVDIGWPGTMGTMRTTLERAGVQMREIAYALATHYHPDHAGLAQEFKHAGVRLILVDVQVALAPTLARIVKPTDGYVPLEMSDNVTVSCAGSRALLATIGLAGQILHTPGHSDDSVSLLLDDGSVFTGDLTPPGFAEEKDAETVAASWALLKAQGATTLYPGHGPVRRLG